MSNVQFPVRTLYLTQEIAKHFGDDLPRLVPVHISNATNSDVRPTNVIMDYEDPIPMPTAAAYIEGIGGLMSGVAIDEMSHDAARFIEGLNGATSVIVSHPQKMDSLLVHMGYQVESLRAVAQEQPELGNTLTQIVNRLPFEGRDSYATQRDFGDCPVIRRIDGSIILAAGRECLATPNGHIVWAGLGSCAENRILSSARRVRGFEEGWADGGAQTKQVLCVRHAEIPTTGGPIQHNGWMAVKGSRFPSLDRA